MAFFQQRDYDLFQSFNKEIINKFIEIPVIIYKLDLQSTETNLYGESVSGKSYRVGFKVNALISIDDQNTIYEGFGADRRQNIQFRFLKSMLEEVSLVVSEGDLISFNDAYFEIDNIIENQLVAKNPIFSHSIICNSHMKRRSGLNIDELH